MIMQAILLARPSFAAIAGKTLRGSAFRLLAIAALAGISASAPLAHAPAMAADAAMVSLKGDGLKRTRSAYGVEETAKRLRADIEAKGIKFFADIDQSALGSSANLELNPSHLLLFGNPPLGVLFLQSAPDRGIDWPVRMLVRQEDDGGTVVVYHDWNWIAARHGIADREKEFAMASEVVASIVGSVADCKNLADCTR